MSLIMTDYLPSDTMFYDKCVMMNVENQETIFCNPEAFHILNSSAVFLFSTIIGVALSFAGVAYVIDYCDYHYGYGEEQDDEPYDSNNELTTPSEDSEETNAFFKKYDDAFNALPASGYEIASYPFVCKAEEMTPMGKVVMFLHVDYDYIKNNSHDSIEYTYYSDKSGYTFNQVSLVAKKIAIDLGTREFYTDKTIDKTILYEALEEEGETDNTLDNTNVVVKEDNEDNEANEKADNDDTTSVFARFKKYNTSSSKNKTTTLNIGTHEITQRQSKIRRVGTLYEYEASLIKENAVKTIKDITFKSFKEQT